jgi:hypothetical protein
MRTAVVLFLAAALSACAREESEREETSSPPESRLEHSAPPPEESRPFRRGFTQRPPPDTPGLPPPPEPFLDAPAQERSAPREARERAQAGLRSLVSDFEVAGAEDAAALLPRIRGAAKEHAREGRLHYRVAEDFFKEYSFPSDVEKADAEHLGNFVVLTGAVAPHNMLDLSDGFKLFEQTPYVHEPMLLATSFELSFLRCHLARKELQPLRDWQEVHVLGVVEGKLGGDLVLKRCVVL